MRTSGWRIGSRAGRICLAAAWLGADDEVVVDTLGLGELLVTGICEFYELCVDFGIEKNNNIDNTIIIILKGVLFAGLIEFSLN